MSYLFSKFHWRLMVREWHIKLKIYDFLYNKLIKLTFVLDCLKYLTSNQKPLCFKITQTHMGYKF